VGSIEGNGGVFLGSDTLLVGSNNSATTFSGVIQDGGLHGGTGGSVTKIGLGTLTLSGANTYTGNTTVTAGVLGVNGSISSNTFISRGGTLAGIGRVNGNVSNHRGTVAPGDFTGALSILGDYTQTDGTLAINIASLADFSVLDISGVATLSGLLDPLLIGDYIPNVGDQFTFLDYSSLSGSLFIHDRNIDGVPEHWEVVYESTYATLAVVAGNVPVPDTGSTFLLLTSSVLILLRARKRFRCEQS
jgi:autotransporter-associated beta strand protein